MRVYFDTNVFVSAFATRGLCADLFQVVLVDHKLVAGEAVMGELRRTLNRKLRMAPALVDEVETFDRGQAEVVAEAPPIQLAVRDAADRLVVAEPVAGEAEVLVTEDSGLLSIAAEAPLPIVAPRAFWELLKAGPRGFSSAS